MNRGQTVGAYAFAIVFFLAGLGIFIYSFSQRSTESRLAASGKHVMGVVKDRQSHVSSTNTGANRGTSSTSYTLDVEYLAGKSSEYHSFDCTQDAFLSHLYGSSVEVIYDPDNPDTATLGGNLNSQSSNMTLLVGSVFMLGGLGMWALFYFYGRNSDGPPVDTLDEAIGHAQSHAPTHWTGDPLTEQSSEEPPTR